MIPRGAIIGILVILVGLYYEQIGNSFTRFRTTLKEKYGIGSEPPKVWLEEHIMKYKHLVIFGHVFDVSSAPKFYGENGHYNFFTGADTTRAFANSDLSGNSFIGNVDGLHATDLMNAFDWLKQFQEKYPHVGYMQGLYFDATGKPTSYYLGLKQSVQDHIKLRKEEDALYPSCNMNSHNENGEVNCIDGFKEDRYPRLLSTPSHREPRCACLTQNYLYSGKAKLYPRCGEFERRCKFTNAQLDEALKHMTFS